MPENDAAQAEKAADQEHGSEAQSASKGPLWFRAGMRWIGGIFAVAIIGLGMWVDYSKSFAGQAQATPTATEINISEETIRLASLPLDLSKLPSYSAIASEDAVIARHMQLHTVIPERPRIEIIKDQVQKGDTLFGIADKFGLKPETILWGNWYTLGGDPHTLRPGQELDILPVNGALHVWSKGEGLNAVAEFYRVDVEDIINWPGNNLDPDIDRSNPPIEEGTALVVPNGRRDPPSWQMVRITRSNPSVAKILGPGYCGAVSSGLIGDGIFGWPTASTWISGYDYMPGVHEAIDIGGTIGTSIFAADDGVVVYAGWNDWGYGNVIVLDHGNGWQTLYAHLSQINVGCGQSASQGQVIAAMGCTGNCTGPHLHFEMRSDLWGRVNPHNFLP
jgi:murein DD-endopeptidase MepM/ murein hydrolase activator NlpD